MEGQGPERSTGDHGDYVDDYTKEEERTAKKAPSAKAPSTFSNTSGSSRQQHKARKMRWQQELGKSALAAGSSRGERERRAMATMQQGQVVRGYFHNRGRPIRQKLYIFYSASMSSSSPTTHQPSNWLPSKEDPGAIYWCEAASRTKSVDCCLPFTQIADVYLGKQTKVFLLPFAHDAVEHMCFSIILKDRTHVNFEALDAEQRSLWVYGIETILLTMGWVKEKESDNKHKSKRKKEKDKDKQRSLQPNNNNSQTVFSQSLSAPNTLHEELVSQLRAGENFVACFSDAAAPPSVGEGPQEAIFIFYEDCAQACPVESPGLGCLYWCDIGMRRASTKRCIPLVQVEEVLLGRMQANEPDVCFSLRTSQNTLIDFLAPSMEVCRSWVSAIRDLCELHLSSPPSVIDQRRISGEASTGAMISGHEGPSRSIEVKNSSALLPARVDLAWALNLTRQGTVLTGYFENRGKGQPIKHKLLVFFGTFPEGGAPALCWCEPGPRVRSAACRMPLSSIVDVYVGKQTKVLFTFTQLLPNHLHHHLCSYFITRSRCV
jgi:hypothetical protein